MNRGITFKNPRTIMDRFSHLKRSHASKMANQQSTSGVKKFSDEDPLADLMEDLFQEIKDNEAMKMMPNRRSKAKRSS